MDISDNIFRRAKAIAKAENLTFRELVEEGLRTVVERYASKKRARIKPIVFKGGSLSREFANASWEDIREEIYGEPDR